MSPARAGCTASPLVYALRILFADIGARANRGSFCPGAISPACPMHRRCSHMRT
ncbi:hypothetical protein BURPS668_A1984 [Burkholderia pseudomallei 668]|nr:hypothetical protein BURPS668_A1984 [Burkholderia pseudomallei 668]